MLNRLVIIAFCALSTTGVFSRATTGDPVTNELINLSNQELFNRALAGKTRLCHIYNNAGGKGKCDYYALTNAYGNRAEKGLPVRANGLPFGSGCLHAPKKEPHYTKFCGNVGVGAYAPVPNPAPTAQNNICTSDHIVNGANMIRNALIEGHCGPVTASSESSTSIASPGTLSDLVVNNKIVFNDSDVGDCRIQGNQVLVGSQNVYPYTKLPRPLCNKLKRAHFIKFGANGAIPAVMNANSLEFFLGRLSQQELTQGLSEVHMEILGEGLDSLDETIVVSEDTSTQVAEKDSKRTDLRNGLPTLSGQAVNLQTVIGRKGYEAQTAPSKTTLELKNLFGVAEMEVMPRTYLTKGFESESSQELQP